MTMILVIFIMLYFAGGWTDAICLNQTIKAVEGVNVTLQYSLPSGENLVDQTIDWKRNDSNELVHGYRHGRDLPVPQYRNRASLDHEDLRRGVVTLHLSSVRLSDRGLYKGYIPGLKVLFYVDLHVEKKQQQTRESSTVGQESSTVGPPVEDAVNVGVDWKFVLVIVAAVVVLILAVMICCWKSGNIRFCPNIASLKTKETGNSQEMKAFGQNTTTERMEEMDD